MALLNQQQLPVVDVRNQLLPDEGPACIPLILDFTTNSTYDIDLSLFMDKGFLSIIQTMWIDTSNAGVPLTVTINNGSQQTLKIAKDTQGYYNVLVSNPASLSFSCPGGPSNLVIILINVPIPGAVWQPAGGGGGGATPGAPLNSVQFNNPLGTFAGDANLTWDASQLRNKKLEFVGADEASMPAFIQNWWVNSGVKINDHNNDGFGSALAIEVDGSGSFVAGVGVALYGTGVTSYGVSVDCTVGIGSAVSENAGFFTRQYIDGNGLVLNSYGLHVAEPSGMTALNALGTVAGIFVENFANHGVTARAILTSSGIVEFGDDVKYSNTNSTGAGAALLGANSPAGTLAAPHTWIRCITADGTVCWIPAWT